MDQEPHTPNSSLAPRAEVAAYRLMPPLTLWPVCWAVAFPWLPSQSTRAHMAPLLLTPLGRYPAALFWDSHVSACDRGTEWAFLFCWRQRMAPAPFRDPPENSNLLVQSTSVLKTQFTFKADVKGHWNYQNEETTSELSHGTIQQQCSTVQEKNSFMASILHRLPFPFRDDMSSVIYLAFCCHLFLTDSLASSTEIDLARLASAVHGKLRKTPTTRWYFRCEGDWYFVFKLPLSLVNWLAAWS